MGRSGCSADVGVVAGVGAGPAAGPAAAGWSGDPAAGWRRRHSAARTESSGRTLCQTRSTVHSIPYLVMVAFRVRLKATCLHDETDLGCQDRKNIGVYLVQFTIYGAIW